MKIEQIVADNIRRIRIEKGMTQEKLAQSCGMQISYIGMIEIRRKNPKLSTIQRIANGLGVHYLELLTPCNQDNSSSQVSEACDTFESVSREIHNVLCRYFNKS